MRPLGDWGELLPHLTPGASIVLHSACAEPRRLARELAEHAPRLRGVRVYSLMPMGACPWAAPGIAEDRLAATTFFPGRGLREAVNAGRAELLRAPVSELCGLFERGDLSADVLLLQVSPPDAAGRMTLGISVDYMRAALERARVVVAEVNPRMPRTSGDTLIDADEVDFAVDAEGPPQEVAPGAAEPVDVRVAERVAGLVPSGAVIQAGIGALPDLVLERLAHLRDLGVHSGMISDALVPLVERGVVTNATKRAFRGKSVTTMAVGTAKLYAFLDGNPDVELHPCSLTHDVRRLAEIDGLHAINGALQVDLHGRVNAEAMDGKIVAGPGGQPDFARGASASRGGASIVALRSTARGGGRSNIVSALPAGAPVTVDAAHVDYVVTEHGVARLRGLDPAARAEQLVAVADPAFRGELRRSRPGYALRDPP
jgi:4-hydroxybutyrate CoA-transferase